MCGHLSATTKPLLSHKIAASLCSLPLVGAPLAGHERLETVTWGPGRRNLSSSPQMAAFRGRKLTLTLIQTGRNILVLLSICPKMLRCPPHWTEGSNGSYPSTSWGETSPPLPTSTACKTILVPLSWPTVSDCPQLS